MRKTVSSVIARALVERAHAEGALVEHALVGRRHRHDAGHFLGVDGLPQDAVDVRPYWRGRPLGFGPARGGDARGCDGSDGGGTLQEVPARRRGWRHSEFLRDDG